MMKRMREFSSSSAFYFHCFPVCHISTYLFVLTLNNNADDDASTSKCGDIHSDIHLLSLFFKELLILLMIDEIIQFGCY